MLSSGREHFKQDRKPRNHKKTDRLDYTQVKMPEWQINPNKIKRQTIDWENIVDWYDKWTLCVCVFF